MDKKIYPVAVIGGGAAGSMAVLRTVLNNDECLFFPGTAKNKKQSRAFWVRKVENIPGFFHYPKGIENPSSETFTFLKDSPFWKKFIWKKNRGIVRIEKKENFPFELEDDQGEHYLCEYLIFCTGAMDRQPIIQGEISPIFPYANSQNVDYCLRCDGHHALGKDIGIIGHDSGAAWVAIMLYERYSPSSVHIFIHGEKENFNEEVQKLINLYKIHVHHEEIWEVEGEKGKLEGLKLKNGKLINIQFAMVSLGLTPYNKLPLSLGVAVDERGFVLANEKGETSLDKVYVAGDLRARGKKQIYTSYDQAVDAADHINMRIRQKKREAILLKE